jgi:hypothetical protein
VAHTDPTIEPAALAAALHYRTFGLRVIPIAPGKKHPPVPEWQKAATCDAAIIEAWWTGLYRGHGVGIATGPGSGVWVLDVDTAGAKVGAASLAELEALYAPLPATVESITGTGGRHLFFTCDPAHPVRNNQSGKAGVDLDVRGDGGQVVAAPTLHPDTHVPYRWRPGRGFGEIAVAPAPPWLYGVLERKDDPPVAAPARPALGVTTPEDDSPAAAFNASTTWDQLLTRDGWTLARTMGSGEQRWVRPGKSARDGISATVGHGRRDVLKVFTSSVPELRADEAYSRFGYEAAVRHHGDRSAFATHLRRQMNEAAGIGQRDLSDLTDMSWLGDTITTPALEAVEDQAPEGNEWPTPEPFEPRMSSGPLFPLDVLPDWIANRVSDVSREVSVPVDYAAIAALGTLSAIAMNRITLDLSERRPDLPLNLWLGAAGESGVSKSHPFEQMVAPLWAFIDDLDAAGAQERSEREAALTVAEKKLKELEGRPQSSPDAPTVQMLGEARLAIEEARSTIPPDPHFIVDDATPEAVAEHYRDCGEVAAIFDDEGSVIDMMAGQYAKDTAAVGPYISGYDRTPINARRVGRGRVTVRRPNLTVCVMTQPVVLAKLGQHSYLAGKGIVPRFLLANPPDTRGWRNYDNQLRPYDPSSKQTYETTMLDLARRLARGGHYVRLRATPEAFERWIEWNKENEPRLRRGGDLRRMVAWYEKIRTATFRTAGLLHLADHPHDHVGEIGVEVFERAFVLAEYWVAHAKVLMEAWVDRQVKDESGVGQRAKSLLEWLVETGQDEVSFSDIRKRLHDNSGLTKDEIIPIVEFLAEGNWVRVPEGFASIARTKRPLRIAIHPEASRFLLEVDDEAPDLGTIDNYPDSPDSHSELQPDGATTIGNRGNRGTGGNSIFLTTTTYPQNPIEGSDLSPNPHPPDSPDSSIGDHHRSSPQPVAETEPVTEEPAAAPEPTPAPVSTDDLLDDEADDEDEDEEYRLWD